MKESLEKNSKYWNDIGANYTSGWKTGSKDLMSQKELDFINKYLLKSNTKNILDIGIGNGRIIGNIIKNTSIQTKIFGIDISEEMISTCNKLFSKSKRDIKIKLCDASDVDKCFPDKFDFITSIRCIKYSSKWKSIIKKIYKKLNDKGVFIFDITNKYSVNTFFRSAIPQYRLSPKEIKEYLKKTGFTVKEMESYNRLPDFLYDLSSNKIYGNLLLSIEKLLSFIFGKTLFGKIIFICAIKE